MGNITQMRDDVASETSNYTYDTLDRLRRTLVRPACARRAGCPPARTSWTLNSTPEAYTYDAGTGNLATKAGSAYTYAANHPDGVSAFNGNTYGYDANGNPSTCSGQARPRE